MADIIIQLMPALKVNIIIVHPWDVVFPRAIVHPWDVVFLKALARGKTTSQG